ncbi:dTDP-4-dehydrorhamnose 3,5-epimerase [Parabacteroides sp. PF5-9]|uniref:dTDP-4-dehydrorhamnose 3,5-epimerase n=1 Tax=Parabacteroides sp. PF5-9 TaxID=1742404 RepID=UPI0024741E75|nr:dTDP-4-dehydrorhamnose 3,5-epimerase [Parabacteroides sp. PF5-9]MDH6357592.1 dTDP-4-dehydrorhamnose 3,5-epimerase [Parabacteroides sp. PF5-9]
MTFTQTAIPEVWIIEPKVFSDERGYFMEAYKQEEFEKHIGKVCFIQDNESCSSQNVLRGLHFQLPPYSQAKLVRVIKGSVLDVAIDIRPGSPTFGQHVAVELSETNKRQLFVPRNFAHGFKVLSKEVIFTYKVDNPYMPSHERGIRYDDPAIGIDWGITDPEMLILSEKDRHAPLLSETELTTLF